MSVISFMTSCLEFESGALTTDPQGSLTYTNSGGVTSTTGKVGGAAQFSGAQSISTPDILDISMGGGNSYSIAVWVYLDSLANIQTIIRKAVSGGNEFLLGYFGTGTGLNRFDFGVSSDGVGAFSGEATANNFGAASLSTWYFLVARYNATAQTLDISVNNGTPNSVSYTLGVNDSTSPLHVGSLENSSDFLSGRVDQLMIWKRAISDADVTWLYNSGNGRSYAAVVAEALPPFTLIGRTVLDYVD